jgi:sigma-B regulation protein RsbU (phosphoserine phosphatase)
MLMISVILAFDQVLIMAVDDFLPLSLMEIVISTFILTDILLLLFMIPSLAVLRVVEKQAIRPMLDFSQIEDFVSEGEKIESDGLVKVYSDYLDEPTEVGVLARSYTDLINYNNRYIDNIAQIEGEKERIKAELDIATTIQAARLPTEAIETDNFIVEGSSRPAKEVGGDFFDYYMLDEDNLALIIGDASGKGVPAALLAVITQEVARQIIKNERDPSRVLYMLNNQLCENNPEMMFITLWLGIYNKNEKTITFSNAGHNPPLIKDNGEFRLLEVNNGLVLGVMEDFEFVSEKIPFSSELVVFTDGITDATSIDDKMYGEDNLIDFFNSNDYNQIDLLFDKIDEFSKGTEQFDDMTVLILKDQS